MLYVYCYGHAMNLAVKDEYFKATILKELFVISREVMKLVKDSLQWETKLKATRSSKNNIRKRCAYIASNAMDCSRGNIECYPE